MKIQFNQLICLDEQHKDIVAQISKTTEIDVLPRKGDYVSSTIWKEDNEFVVESVHFDADFKPDLIVLSPKADPYFFEEGRPVSNERLFELHGWKCNYLATR